MNLVDWLVIALTAALAALTVAAASYPVVGTDAFYLLTFAWPLPAISWSSRLLVSAEDSIGRAAAGALLVGSVAWVAFPGFPLLGVALFGLVGIAVAGTLGLALFGVVLARAPNRRVAWLVPPTIVIVALVLAVSGVPRLGRIWLAEPALTAYAEQVERGELFQLPAYFDDPVSVAGIPIYEAYVEGGHVHFVTDYVGILADDGAGIAYLPGGPPEADPPYEHLVGLWYRWFPY
jgi:hypothetical protein